MLKDESQKTILNLEQVGTIAANLRRENRKIVLTQGSWDMLHVGHARYLARAKEFGDVLFVGVDSDEKIRHRKGPGRPVVPEVERLEMLTHLSSVDYVVLKALDAPKFSLIKAINPDVLIAIAENYSDSDLSEVKKYCGEVKIIERQATTSTSAKLRMVQIGEAKKIESKLSKAIKDVLFEFKI